MPTRRTRRTFLSQSLTAGAAALAAGPLAKALTAPDPEPIWLLDLAYLHDLDRREGRNAREVWDTLHLAAGVQGLANRLRPRLFLRFMEHPDDFWLTEVRRDGNWLAGREVRRLRSLEEMLAVFQADLRGLVIYKHDVPATSNLASTIAGIESRAPVRYDPAPTSVYARVLATDLPMTRNVLRLYLPDGSPLFTGRAGTTIPDTPGAIPTTGSPKCDAYLWAKARYLDTQRASREYLAYYIDAYWLTDPTISRASNCTLTNHDFFIAKGAMFFDLHVWPEETPVDDPTQRAGEDLRTLRAILRSMYAAAKGKIFHIGGFTPWAWKYTSHGRAGSRHGGVDTEWQYARVISAYNGIMDADALDFSGMTNASFYQHFPLEPHYPQHVRLGPQDLRKGGLIRPDGSVAPYCYVLFYLGDYDSAAWLNYHLPTWWKDAARGRIPLAWAFNPNLDRRAPHAMHYARKHATDSDWFISGDCGAGYLNPGMLAEPRLEADLPAGWDAWISHNLPYYKRYDLSITGFVIDGHAPGMGQKGMDAYQRFSPDGIIGQKIPAQGLHADTMPYIRMKTDLDGTPEQAGRQIAGMVGEMDEPRFCPIRTILKSPTWHKQVMEHAAAAEGGDRLRFVDPYTFLLLLKTFERGRRPDRMPGLGESVRFIAPREVHGLTPVPADDGPFERRRVAGREAIHQKSDRMSYLYFETARRFVHDLPADTRAKFTVEVVVFDSRKGALTLEYDSHDGSAPVEGAYASAPPVNLAGSQRWVTVTFELTRPRLAGRQNVGASFRLVNGLGELAVHSVTLAPSR